MLGSAAAIGGGAALGRAVFRGLGALGSEAAGAALENPSFAGRCLNQCELRAVWGGGRDQNFYRQGARSRWVHDQYLDYVRPGAVERRLDTSWTSSIGLGARKPDDIGSIAGERIGFEANTSSWSRLTRKDFGRKMDQVGADLDLLDQHVLDRSSGSVRRTSRRRVWGVS